MLQNKPSSWSILIDFNSYPWILTRIGVWRWIEALTRIVPIMSRVWPQYIPIFINFLRWRVRCGPLAFLWIILFLSTIKLRIIYEIRHGDSFISDIISEKNYYKVWIYFFKGIRKLTCQKIETERSSHYKYTS